MTTELACLSVPERILHGLVAEVCARYRCHLHDLWVEVVEEGVVVCGRAVTFYGKQIAFHEVRRRCGLPVVGNQVEVRDDSAD